ncbi:unnamed protein product [Cochlearia groenlandica]
MVVDECSDDEFFQEKKKVVRNKNVSQGKKPRDDEARNGDDFQEEMARESPKKLSENRVPEKEDTGQNLGMDMKGIFSLFEALTTNMQGLQKKLEEKFTCFQGDMARRMSAIESKLDAKIENLGKKVKKWRWRNVKCASLTPKTHYMFHIIEKRVEAISKRLDEKKTIGKKRLFMAATQKYQFQGDSTMKRVMQGVVPSLALYDPFGPCNEVKAQELLDRIAEEE